MERNAMLARIRGLLAKAESTDFAAEADAFMAKAQQLIAQHAIDTAELADDGNGTMGAVRLWIADPYSDAKCRIAHSMSAHFGVFVYMTATMTRGWLTDDDGCERYSHDKGRWLTVVGTETAREVFDIVLTSVLAQAAAGALRINRASIMADYRANGFQGSDASLVRIMPATRTVRDQFLVGFGQGVADQCRRVNESTGTGSGTAALVLVDAASAAEAHARANAARLRSSGSKAGSASGRAAGRTADLNRGRVASRRAIGSGR